MENLRDLRIIAYRLKRGDYLGTVGFSNPKFTKPGRSRYFIPVMFQYEKNPITLEQTIRIENGDLKEYLEENDLMNGFLELVDEATVNDDYKLV